MRRTNAQRYLRAGATALLAHLCALASAQVGEPLRGGIAQPVIEPAGDENAPSETPMPLPDASRAVLQLLEASYLTDSERADLRVEHGIWNAADLSNPTLLARASLIQGDLRKENFIGANPLDKAEAALRRGEPETTLTLLEKQDTIRSIRLRAEALIDLGRSQDAEHELDTVRDRVLDPDLRDASELAEGARAMILLARLRGAESEKSVGYQELLTLLGGARDTLDRLSWRVQLSEALLLYEKDMYAECSEALEACLALCPRNAEAWSMLGELAGRTFDFPTARRCVLRLEDLAQPSISAPAAMVRAIALLRQNEGQSAEEALAPALDSYPSLAPLVALRCASAAVSFDFDRADNLMSEFDRLAPGSALAYLEAGRALADARQYEDASRYLTLASDRAPLWAAPRVELGLCELQAGRLEESARALDAALLLDRHHARARNSQLLLRELASYASVESEHFVVRYKPGEDEPLAREMLPTLERIFLRVTGDDPGGIDHAPATKTVVELYPNHRWFATRIVGMTQVHTFAAATGPVIAMETPRSGPGHLVGPYDWARVVQHEYTHTVTLSRTKNRLPHWFTEAGAVILEDAPRDYPTVQLLTRALENDALFNFEDINVMFVRPRRPSDRAQAYAQGAWMYEYILDRWGARAPLELMDLYATGVREEQAFEQVLGLSRDRFAEEFKSWAGEQVVAWGMRAPEGAPTIAQLLEEHNAASPSSPLVKEWLEFHPEHPDVLELAAKDIARKPKPDWTNDDVEILHRYAMARPVDPLPHRELARFFLDGHAEKLGLDADEAAEHLEYLDAREQHSPSFAAELARRYADKHEWTQAINKASRAAGIAPYDGTIRELAASICLRAGDTDGAERHIWALTMIEPGRAVHKQRLEQVRKLRSLRDGG